MVEYLLGIVGRFLKTGRIMKRAIIAVAAVLAGFAASQARIITVDDDGPADFSTIQAAIDDANDGDTILVVDGTYTGAGNRDIDFDGKGITVKSQNGPENCIIDCNGTEADQHRGFYFHCEEDACSAVIGFTITNGYPPGECLVRPPFTCVYLGGAIRCKESSPAISHCIITGNRADKGGGIYLEGGAPEVSHCTILGNHAVNWGGGIAVNSSDAEISNSIIWGNSAPSSPEIYNAVSGSATVAYSDVEGGWAGTGNIDGDPCFADPGYWDPNGTPEDANDDFWVDGDYHVKSQGGRYDPNEGGWTMDDVTSVCIDAGDPSAPIGPEPFPNGGRINIGAYGGTSEASKSYFGAAPCETIVAGDINGDCRVEFSDFAILASHWLEWADRGLVFTDVKMYRCELIEGRFIPQEEVDKVTVGDAFTIRVEVTNFGSEMIETDCFYGWELVPENAVEVIGESTACATLYRLQPGESMWKIPFCGSFAFEAEQPGWVTMSVYVKGWCGVLCEHTLIFEIL